MENNQIFVENNQIFVVKRDFMGAIFAGEEIRISFSSDSILVTAINRGWPDQVLVKSRGKAKKFTIVEKGVWSHYAMQVRFKPVPVHPTKYMHDLISQIEWNMRCFCQFIEDLKLAGVI